MNNIIFIHSFMRSSSTYFAIKFRTPKTILFFEPYNDFLKNCSAESIKKYDYRTWNSHHSAAAPYFEEYQPFLNAKKGIKNFSSDFHFKNYFSSNLSRQEYYYLQQFIDYSWENNKIPCFGFIESSCRAPLLLQNFQGIHICQYRNPIDVLHSIFSYPFQSTFFPKYINNLSAIHRDILSIHEEYNQTVLFLSDELIVNYFKLWLISTLTAGLYSNILVNIDKVSEDDIYKKEIIGKIEDVSGIHIDLDDCVSKGYTNCLPVHLLTKVFETLFDSDQKANKFIRTVESIYNIPSILTGSQFKSFLEDISKRLYNESFSHKEYCAFYEKNTHLMEKFINDKFNNEITAIKKSRTYKFATVLRDIYHHICLK